MESMMNNRKAGKEWRGVQYLGSLKSMRKIYTRPSNSIFISTTVSDAPYTCPQIQGNQQGPTNISVAKAVSINEAAMMFSLNHQNMFYC
jgi:hypothetical protein